MTDKRSDRGRCQAADADTEETPTGKDIADAVAGTARPEARSKHHLP
jgi:hypothetical protein